MSCCCTPVARPSCSPTGTARQHSLAPRPPSLEHVSYLQIGYHAAVEFRAVVDQTAGRRSLLVLKRGQAAALAGWPMLQHFSRVQQSQPGVVPMFNFVIPTAPTLIADILLAAREHAAAAPEVCKSPSAPLSTCLCRRS